MITPPLLAQSTPAARTSVEDAEEIPTNANMFDPGEFTELRRL